MGGTIWEIPGSISVTNKAAVWLLGAENLIAGVDVSDCIELEEKGIGRRKIKITNKKMKDAELREPIFMEAYREVLGTDENGRSFGSLVLRRCHGAAKAGG